MVVKTKQRVKAYTKNPAIDPEEATKRAQQEQVFKDRALNALRENEHLRQVHAEVTRDNLDLKLQVFTLTEKLLLAEADKTNYY